MADLNGTNHSKNITGEAMRPLLPLRYYVHDSVQGLRFQLIGIFGETDIAELAGCWSTARTILGTRQLVIDLRALQSTDEAGRQWLLSLANDGAQYLPDSYFRSGLAPHKPGGVPRKIGLFSRMLSVFRGRPVAVESSTRAQ